MRNKGESVVVHARVKSQDEPLYIGSVAYPDPSADGDRQRKSYLSPDSKAKYNQVSRSSLFSEDDPDRTPVGCVVSQGQTKWYVVDGLGNLAFLPEGRDGKFFRAGEGKAEHFRFWDPLKNKTCQAVFLGVERPEATSPRQEPYDAETDDLRQGFSRIDLQTRTRDKGKTAEANEGWSEWVWREQYNC
jgi:hypothetical protein